MENYRYSGEDIIYNVVITDSDGNPINYADTISATFEFSNAISVKKKKTTGIEEGDTSNTYRVELQDVNTNKLSKGTVNVKITLVLSDADFIEGEATVITYDSFVLK